MNGVADTYAKRAVEAHRVPYRVRQEIKDYNELTIMNAMWVGRATVLANQSGSLPERDSEASRERALQAAREKRKQKLEGSQADANTTFAQPITVAEGGHNIERCELGWRCTTCRIKAVNRDKLALQKC